MAVTSTHGGSSKGAASLAGTVVVTTEGSAEVIAEGTTVMIMLATSPPTDAEPVAAALAPAEVETDAAAMRVAAAANALSNGDL